MKRAANLGLSVLLSGLVSVVIAAFAVPAATGTQAVSITANSMQQVLPLGSLVYIRAESFYRPGDWVTFRRNGTLITHEVVGYTENPANGDLDGTYLQTKGTNSPAPDPYPISRDSVVGKVIYHLPVMGIALKTLSAPVVMAFLALLTVGLYWLSGRHPRYLLNKVRVEHPTHAYLANSK